MDYWMPRWGPFGSCKNVESVASDVQSSRLANGDTLRKFVHHAHEITTMPVLYPFVEATRLLLSTHQLQALSALGIADAFDFIIAGDDAAVIEGGHKPDPFPYMHAAERLGSTTVHRQWSSHRGLQGVCLETALRRASLTSPRGTLGYGSMRCSWLGSRACHS